jgi:4-carboxymuconolactone decarboxylase
MVSSSFVELVRTRRLEAARTASRVMDARRVRSVPDRRRDEGGAEMQTSASGDGSFQRGDGSRFTGEVWIRSTLAAEDGTNVGVVHFSPAARTRWHRHPGGQFLYGVSGRGRVRTRGERGFLLGPGDVVHVRADEWHFHGGDADSPMVHVAVNGGGDPEWGEAVTDEEFAEGF